MVKHRQYTRACIALGLVITAFGLLLVGFSSGTAGEQSVQRQQSQTAGAPTDIKPAPKPSSRSRYAPYWYFDDNTDSFLEVRSHFGKSAIALLPTAVTPSGELKLHPITVPPFATVRVALKSQLRELQIKVPSPGREPRHWGDGSRSNSAWGGLRLELMSPPEATAEDFNGWILVENPSEKLGSMSMLENPGDAIATNLEGLWWTPYVDTQVYFALQNTTESPLAVRLILSDEKGNQIGTSDFKIDKLGMRLVSVREVLGAQPLPQIGSASFSTPAKPGAIVIRGRLLQEKMRFSASWKLQETQKLTNIRAGPGTELHAPAAYFGKLNQLTHRGEAYLYPHLILKNVSESNATVMGVAYGKDKEGNPAELKIEPMTILPNNTVHIDLQDKRKKDRSILADGAAGVRLSHDGGPTDVVAELLSIDETGQVVFYDDVRNLYYRGAKQSAISFNLEDENRSFLIIKNTTDKPRKPSIFLYYNDGRDHYEANLKDIPPQQVEIVDFRHLRDTKIPDLRGHILPPDLKFGGSIIFSEPGAFVVSDPTFMYGSRPTPAGDPPDDEPYFAPSCVRVVGGPPPCFTKECCNGQMQQALSSCIFKLYREECESCAADARDECLSCSTGLPGPDRCGFTYDVFVDTHCTILPPKPQPPPGPYHCDEVGLYRCFRNCESSPRDPGCNLRCCRQRCIGQWCVGITIFPGSVTP
jgi:hypothetical protein